MCQIFINADPQLYASRSRSIRLHGVATSLRLENLFWQVLEEIGQRDALSVPQQAVVRTSGQTSVWVVDANGQAQQIAVTTGELVARQYRIASGLSAGQQVVIEGIDRLTPGAQVIAHPWQPLVASQQAGTHTR